MHWTEKGKKVTDPAKEQLDEIDESAVNLKAAFEAATGEAAPAEWFGLSSVPKS